MNKLTFQGHSDDTFSCEGQGVDIDHDDCARLSVRTIEVSHGPHRMAVTGVYGHGCMWSIGIAPVDDDEPLPPWPMVWSFQGYTAVLVVEVPDGASVRLVCPSETEEV